jgi:hypothetical protein
MMSELNTLLEPGQLVRNPNQPDWGVGQVQSNVVGKVTVNFRERGKVVIVGSQIELELVFDL